MATARDLIQASLRVLGVLPSGETPNANEANEAFEALQIMLKRWAANSLDIFAISQDSIQLQSGKGEYTYGPGGDIDTIRPSKILGAFTRDENGNDYQIGIIDAARYREIVAKGIQSSIVWALYPNYAWPFTILNLFPVPSDDSYTLFLDSLKPFIALTDLSDEIQFPPEYQAAIKWNLAIELAPEYGRRLAPEIVALARDSLESLERLNSVNLLKQDVPVLSSGKTYDIYSDQ